LVKFPLLFGDNLQQVLASLLKKRYRDVWQFATIWYVPFYKSPTTTPIFIKAYPKWGPLSMTSSLSGQWHFYMEKNISQVLNKMFGGNDICTCILYLEDKELFRSN